MEWNQIERNWPQFKNIIKHQWEALTDHQIDLIAGDRHSLISKIQSSYEIDRPEAELQVAEWQNEQINIDGHFYQVRN